MTMKIMAMTTVSEMPRDVKDKIEMMLELLGVDNIAREVEYPIDKATAGFQFTIENIMTPAIFNRVILSFIKHLYRTALRFPRTMSDREALAEAIHLLSHYSDAEGPDRYGAILTVVTARGREELEKVLLQLSEIIKEIERRKYKRWVFIHHFWSLGWKRQCHIVAAYKESISQSLSMEMQRLKPEQLVEYFEDLINIELMCRNIFKQMGFEKGEKLWKKTSS